MDEDKIKRMQFLEQNLQSIMMQKQSFQIELNEILASISEIENSKDDIYKMVGQIMIKSDKDKILEELKTQEKLVSSKVNLLSNEEKKFNDQLKEIRNEMIGSIGKKD